MGGESGGRECAVYSFDLLVHARKYSETPYKNKTEISQDVVFLCSIHRQPL